jgi:hypothetical protein
MHLGQTSCEEIHILVKRSIAGDRCHSTREKLPVRNLEIAGLPTGPKTNVISEILFAAESRLPETGCLNGSNLSREASPSGSFRSLMNSRAAMNFVRQLSTLVHDFAVFALTASFLSLRRYGTPQAPQESRC